MGAHRGDVLNLYTYIEPLPMHPGSPLAPYGSLSGHRALREGGHHGEAFERVYVN